MLAAKDNPCRKFQANIFNKTKCQNCFKPRESHLLCDEDLNQAKPVYGGWLCLAPEGTDFENPMQRSRKWQRRFFLLFEHGGLRYALDELTSTLPQGTINMNQATEVVEAESRTGQKNSLCIATPDREYFIRAETKEDLNGWYEMLGPYPRANKQNQKKKRKVDPPTQQEPGPAKVTVTSTSIPAVEKIPDPKSSLWQEELKHKAQRSRSPSEGSAHDDTSHLSEVMSDHSSVNGDETDPWRKNGYFMAAESGGAAGGAGTRGRGAGSGSGSSSRSSMQDVGSPGSVGLAHLLASPTHSDPFASPLPSPDPYANGGVGRTASQAAGDAGQHGLRYGGGSSSSRSRSGTMEEDLPERMELDYDHEQERGAERQGRSEKRAYALREQEWKKGDVAVDISPAPHAPLRRAKSLDRRTTESLMTPDLLNFKKGWMVKLDDDCQWKKHWFVLTDHGLRYYKDSIAEEASDLDGEIDLSTCYGVTEVQAQRNYGFQIQTKEGSFTLSAMTTGIRRNWIQAIMKNVRPSTAPDVTSFPEEKAHASTLPDTVPKLDTRGTDASLLAPDSAYSGADGEQQQQQQSSRKSRARDRRREGRSKTFDWAEFRPNHQQQALAGCARNAPDGGGGGGGGGGDGDRGGGRCGFVPDETQRVGAGEPERDRARRWEERRKRYSSTEVEDGAMDVEDRGLRPPVTPPAPPPAQQPLSPAHDDMQDEIEQRWQQVEQTPLRESKQVPIHSHLTPTAQRPPTDGLVELLEKEIEALKLQLQQTQQELTSLQERNSSLHSQLTEALQREQSTRLGYVSQSGALAGAGSGVRQQLRRLNKELRAELERQRERLELVTLQSRTLRQSYTASRELIQRQEAELASLHKCVEVLSAERAALEQSLGEALLGREEERADGPVEGAAAASAAGASEVAARLGESEAKLEAARSLLLEKTQALGELERQVEMQGNQQEVVQRLRERLEEATERLRASERELAKSREDFEARRRALLETQEAKTQGIRRRLQELEDALKEREERVEKLETCVDRLENEKVAAVLENRKLEQKMRDDEVSLESLQRSKETVEEDNQQLYQRQKEVLNQLSESNKENSRIKAELEYLREYRSKHNDFTDNVNPTGHDSNGSSKCQCKEDCERLLKELDSVKDDLRTQRILNRELGESYSELSQDMEALKVDLEQQCTEKNEIKDFYESLSQEMERVRAILKETDFQINCFKNECEEQLEKVMPDILDRLNTVAKNLSEAEKRLEFGQEELRRMSGNKVHSEDEKGRADLVDQLQQEEAKVSSLQAELGALQQSYEQLSLNHTKLKEDYDVLETAHNNSCKEWEQMKFKRGFFRTVQQSEAAHRFPVSKGFSLKEESSRQQAMARHVEVPSAGALGAGSKRSLWGQRSAGSSNSSGNETLRNQSGDEQIFPLSSREDSLQEFSGKKVQPPVDLDSTSSSAGLKIQSLEAKLLATEEKLRVVTASLVEQKAWEMESRSEQLAQKIQAEKTSQEQLQASEEELTALTAQLQIEKSQRWRLVDETDKHLQKLEAKIAEVQETIIACKGKVEKILKDKQVAESQGIKIQSLSEVERALANVIHSLEQTSLVQEKQEAARGSEVEGQEASSGCCQTLPQDENLQALAGKLVSEALIMARLISVLHNTGLHSLASVDELNVEIEKLASVQHAVIVGEASQGGDSLTRKLLLEGEFWTELQQLKVELQADSTEESSSEPSEIIQFISTLVDSTLLRGELALVLQSVQKSVDKKFGDLQSELSVALQRVQNHKKMLQRVMEACKISTLVEVREALEKWVEHAEGAEKLGKVKKCGDAKEPLREHCNEPPGGNSQAQMENLQGGQCASVELADPALEQIASDSEAALRVECEEHILTISKLRQELEELRAAKDSQSEPAQELEGTANKEKMVMAKDKTEMAARFKQQLYDLTDVYEEKIEGLTAKFEEAEELLKTKLTEKEEQILKLTACIEELEREHSEKFTQQLQNVEASRRGAERLHREELDKLRQEFTLKMKSLQQEDRNEPLAGLQERLRPKAKDLWRPSQEEASPTVHPKHQHHQRDLQKGASENTVESFESAQEDVSDAYRGGDALRSIRSQFEALQLQLSASRVTPDRDVAETDVGALHGKHQADVESLKATCERGFAAMEDSHQKVIEELQRAHQAELEKLRLEKDKLLAEETAATIAAIEAMKNAHREELERELEKVRKSETHSVNRDMEAVHEQHEEEMMSVQREIEVLSEQYSQKCLEGAHLAQALDAERQALRQCQRENQELNAHNQELNNRLAAEISRLRGLGSADASGSPVTQGVYELEVLLRVKESEIQYLKQEINSLKEELQTALRDKKYAADKHKDIYKELSFVRANAERDIGRLQEQVESLAEALGDRQPQEGSRAGFDIMKSKSNPDILKMGRPSSSKRADRALRSKSVVEQEVDWDSYLSVRPIEPKGRPDCSGTDEAF
ncbi:uncharacterized protein LOC116951360 isoform X1 [Petromyzon marinus]|uniref:uncharacterized protein LOC116951360 isoform X1 n=1 Tax=Petromyzon marinus TaxID=7757 RepID=UPI003F71CBEB